MKRVRNVGIGLAAIVVMATGLSACGEPKTPADASGAGAPPLPPLANFLVDEQLKLTPEWGRWSGLHEYDGKLPDYSAAGIERRIRALVDTKALIVREAPARAADPEESLDLALHAWNCDEQLFWLKQRQMWKSDPSFYEGLFSVNTYIDRDYVPFEKRFAALVEHEENALKQVAHVRANLVLPLPKPLVDVGIGIYKGYASYLLKDVVEAAAKTTDPALKARFEKANTALAAEAKGIADWLSQVPTNDKYALGADDFQKLVDIYAGTHLSLADFKATGADMLARDQKLHDELAPRVTQPHKPTAETLVATAQKLTDDARKFIIEKKIVSLPTDERAVVIETPPYKRFNAAWLDTPGPYDPPLGAFFYVTPPDASWPKERQLEYIPLTSELRATSTHEVYPGHFVQYQFQRKAPTKTQKVLGSSTFIEGWAHYGEQMMAEEGFSADPENHLGQVTEALLRDCRFLVALGVHAEGMTIAQAEERFVKDCHQTSAVAKEQSLRAAFHPWYFAYSLGKLQILALREEAKRAPGYTLQRFHDALLSHGQGPVGLIRPRVLRDLATTSGAPSRPETR